MKDTFIHSSTPFCVGRTLVVFAALLFGVFLFVPIVTEVTLKVGIFLAWVLLLVLLLGLFMRARPVFRRLLLKMQRVYPAVSVDAYSMLKATAPSVFRHSFLSSSLKSWIIKLALIAPLLLPAVIQAQGYIDVSTYLGGSDDDKTIQMEVVGNEVHLLGITQSLNFPVTNSTVSGGGYDVFYAKLDATTGAILVATYLGGDDVETPVMMVVIGNEVFIAGSTLSPDFPVTNGGSNSGVEDIFYTKLDATTGAIITSVLVGSSSDDLIADMEVVGNEVFLFGTTGGGNYPVTNGSVYVDLSGGKDVVYTKLDATTGVILSSTYLGSTANDGASAMQVIGNEVHLIGTAASGTFPVTNGSIYNGGAGDIFYTRLDGISCNILTSVFVGGGNNEIGFDMQVIGSTVYVTGSTSSLNLPVTNGRFYAGGGFDGFYVKLDANSGAVLSGTFLGGSAADAPYKIRVIGNEVYLMGQGTVNFPTTDGSVHMGGTYDYFVAKLNANTSDIIFATLKGGSGAENSPVDFVVYGNKIYLTGTTQSPNFPVTDGSTYRGGGDIALMELNATTGAITYSTLTGGSGLEVGAFTTIGIEVQVVGSEIHLMGTSRSINYPVTNLTTGSASKTQAVYTKLQRCPDFNLPPVVAVSPATQTVCQLGLATIIYAAESILPSGSLPNLYRNGVITQQNQIEANYQWQSADSPGGPWMDIPVGILAYYLPSVGNTDQYYRRLSSTSAFCGDMVLVTSDVAAVLVNGNIAPVPNAGGSFTTCSGTAVALGGTPAATGGLPPYLYDWDIGASDVEHPSVTPAATTIFTLTVTDDNGCAQIDQAVVQVYSANAGPDVSFCGGTAGVRIGGLPVAGVPGVVYSWLPSMGLSCTDCAQPMANPASATIYTLTMTLPYTGGGTCVTVDAVTVTPVAAPVTANFAGPDVVICLGATALLGTPGEPGFTYT